MNVSDGESELRTTGLIGALLDSLQVLSELCFLCLYSLNVSTTVSQKMLTVTRLEVTLS